MYRISVLASTRGTDLQAIIDEIAAKRLHAKLACVISNKSDCYALERARNQGFKTYFIDPKNISRGEFDRKIADILIKEKTDLVVLVGYMRILTPAFVKTFKNRIINVHPALIPKYCGKAFYGQNVHEAVLAANETETGMTIHMVDEGVDEGKILIQKTCPVLKGDTPETLRDRVQALEKEWYPRVIESFAKGELP